MAHTKAGGSTALGRDSASKRLGVKKFSGERVRNGNIIIRQRGTKFRLGEGVAMGTDNTIFATTDGVVQFLKRKLTRFTGKLKTANIVSVVKQ